MGDDAIGEITIDVMTLSDPRCRVEMLGPLRLVRLQTSTTRFATQKAAALLAYLALHLGPNPREQILDLFWPDMDLASGRNNLSTALSSLRRQLEPAGVTRGSVLFTTHAQIGLNPAAVTTDVADFEHLLEQAKESNGAETRAGLLSRAVALYRADFQPGNYQDWAVREAERLHARRVEALDQLGDDREALGQFPDAVAATQQRLTADPYAEGTYVSLVRRYLRSGQPASARETAGRMEKLFQEEFGVGPSPDTRRALHDLLHGVPNDPVGAAPPAVPDPPPGSEKAMRTETEKAKKPEEAEHLAPPSATLPFWLSRFFGREPEMAQLADQLLLFKEDPALTPELPQKPCRLLTLSGPGGAGKTRLAAEFARLAAERFGARCIFVPLADLRAPAQIPAQVLQALGLAASPTASASEQLLAFFGDRDRQGAAPALLILDNLEHLLEPNAQAAGMVQALLRSTAGLTVLCTSRRALGLSGERLLPLGPLPLPPVWDPAAAPEDLAALVGVPSVRLYCDRAQEVRPDFGLTPTNAPSVCALCRALEGSPLALELAASWVRLLPPSKMWERLSQGLGVPAGRQRDLPARHRSLSAALEWSWLLLTPAQQRLLAQLSIFRGGWTLEAAEAVCDAAGTLELLADLGDASLVEPGERHRLLETVRAFSRQALEERGEGEALRKRHADYFRTVAAEAEPEMHGPHQKQRLDLLESEHDNLRAVLDGYAASAFVSSAQEAQDGLRLVSALTPFWRARGHLQEGRDRCRALLTRPAAAARTAARADALNGAGELTSLLTAYSEAADLHEEALSISREVGYAAGEADALLGLGTSFYWRQDYSAAARFYEESLERRGTAEAGPGCEPASEAHRLWGEAATYHSLGNLALRWEEYAEAPVFFERALALRRRQGDLLAVAGTLGGLGQAAVARGDYTEGARRFLEALRLFDEAGQRWTVALCLSDLGRIAAAQGKTARAVRLLGAAAALRERFHFPSPPNERAGEEEHLSLLRARLGNAAFESAWAEGGKLSWVQTLAQAGAV